MFKKKIEQKIEKIAKEFFQKISFEVDIEVEDMDEFTIPVLITMEEPQILIGENGKTLFSIQHLLSKLLRKQLKKEERFYIDLDINGYKKKKIDYLKDAAQKYADDVVFSKKEKELTPMSAYERRIIHLELQERNDVVTESIGQDPDRKIIIKLA